MMIRLEISDIKYNLSAPKSWFMRHEGKRLAQDQRRHSELRPCHLEV
jgi:2-hydroxychromene-2-carboxylate isomerase